MQRAWAQNSSEPRILIGDSAAMAALRAAIASAARTAAKVLIIGETGVGKEVVAWAIHEQSARAARALFPVTFGGIPEALLDSALLGHVRGSFAGEYRQEVGLLREAA